MDRIEIPFDEFTCDIIKNWRKDWFLLTSGENAPGKFNTMTVAWGSTGVMWQKPFVQIVVRPSRYTMDFLDKSDSFTLTLFPEQYRSALNLCGTKSGRDMDKVAEAGLTAIPSETVASPAFDEAELIIECKIIYRDTFKPENFEADYIEPCYNGSDYHNVLFGEITRISGIEKYKA